MRKKSHIISPYSVGHEFRIEELTPVVNILSVIRFNFFCHIQEITYSMLSEMNLLDMCAQESLRMYPPAGR